MISVVPTQASGLFFVGVGNNAETAATATHRSSSAALTERDGAFEVSPARAIRFMRCSRVGMAGAGNTEPGELLVRLESVRMLLGESVRMLVGVPSLPSTGLRERAAVECAGCVVTPAPVSLAASDGRRCCTPSIPGTNSSITECCDGSADGLQRSFWPDFRPPFLLPWPTGCS